MKKPVLDFETQLKSVPVRNENVRLSPSDMDPEVLIAEVTLKYSGLLALARALFKARNVKRIALTGLTRELYGKLDGKRTVEDLIDHLIEAEKLTFFEARALVTQYLKDLMQRGLVAIVSGHATRKRVNTALLIAGLALVSGTLPAGDDGGTYGPKPKGEAAARAQYEANLSACKGNPHKLVLPGLVADRKARTVEVLAESTGLQAEEIVEFLLVDQSSDRGYEALLWSYAKPSDVHRALEFIGLVPGAPYNPAALCFWPDGGRVLVAVTMADGKRFPIERLVTDTVAGTTLPESGFVFGGSVMAPPRDGKGEALYGADVDDVRSVASIYNNPLSVLDVPRQVNKSEAYGQQVVNPDYALPYGELLTVVMTPGEPGEQPCAGALTLSIDRAVVSNGIACCLSEADGSVLLKDNAITPVLERITAVGKGEEAVRVDLSFGQDFPLVQARRVCAVMAMMESMGVVRIEPPAAGQLYYRAFLPDKQWLTPAQRPAQVWELHLARKDGRVAGQLVWHEEDESGGGSTPVYTTIASDVATSRDVRARLEAFAAERQAAGKTPPPAVMLVYAAPGLRYGETVSFVAPSVAPHDVVYVFTETM